MGIPIALTDLSLCLYKFRYYYKDACRYDSNGQALPTGHVYGTAQFTKQLSQYYKAVVLIVDSHAPHRYEVLSSYKSGRHTPTGNPFEDYKLSQDIDNILKLCTSYSNVFYIKHDGMEADDIIQSWIHNSNTDDKWDLHCYFNDNDILQTQGHYHWHKSFHDPEVDRKAYIKEKYGLGLDYLPVWYKVVRGDKSDGIPIGIPRFPSAKLIDICYASAALEGDTLTWFLSMLDGEVTTEEQVAVLRSNLQVISPIVKPISDFKLKRYSISRDEFTQLLQFYQINDFIHS